MFFKDIYSQQDDCWLWRNKGFHVWVCVYIHYGLYVWLCGMCGRFYKADQPESPLSGAWRSLCPIPFPPTSLLFPGFSLQWSESESSLFPLKTGKINAHFSKRLLKSWVQVQPCPSNLVLWLQVLFHPLSSLIFSFHASPPHTYLSEKSFSSLPIPSHVFLSAH